MITSVNLAAIAFQSNTDSTRLQMSSKQLQQTLTHPNCDIPFVVGSDYNQISKYSKLGIRFASGPGNVVFKNNDLMVVNYDNGGLKIHEIPQIKKTHGSYSSCLRSALTQGRKFIKDDILFEYDCFKNGIPSIGYNAFTAYNIWFGLVVVRVKFYEFREYPTLGQS